MATTRKTLGDRLNAAADGAISTLISVSKGEIEDTSVVNARVGAAKAILNKVIPDIKAVEIQGDLNITSQEFIIGGEDDTSQA
jgi:hypothetical protein